MSLAKLERTIQSFGAGRWAAKELGAIAEALGDSIKPKERARLAELLDASWEQWGAQERRALEVIARHAAPDLKPTPLTFKGASCTEIDEQSALTFVSREIGFLTIADEKADIYQIPAEGGVGTKIRDDDGVTRGLEGCAYDENSSSLLVVSENTRRVHELAMHVRGGAVTFSKPEELIRLPNISTAKNKGWEGIAVLPEKFTGDGKARLLAVHEASPRAIGIFDRATGDLEHILELGDELAPHPLDLSDIAVDKKTGRVFLLSHESAAIYEVDLRETHKLLGAGPPAKSWALVPIAEIPLPKKYADIQAEGLDFDARGDLHVTGEVGCAMLHFERGRAAS